MSKCCSARSTTRTVRGALTRTTMADWCRREGRDPPLSSTVERLASTFADVGVLAPLSPECSDIEHMWLSSRASTLSVDHRDVRDPPERPAPESMLTSTPCQHPGASGGMPTLPRCTAAALAGTPNRARPSSPALSRVARLTPRCCTSLGLLHVFADMPTAPHSAARRIVSVNLRRVDLLRVLSRLPSPSF